MNKIEQIIMVGLPCSGKSTIIKNVLDTDGPWLVYSVDNELEAIAASKGKTYDDVYDEHFSTAEAQANAKLEKFKILRQKQPLLEWRAIFDQTNLGVKKRARSVRMFSADAGKVVVHCFLPPKDNDEMKILRDRNKNRPGKTIPFNVYIKMMRGFVLPTIEEGFADVIYHTLDGKTVEYDEAVKIFEKSKEFFDTRWPKKET